MEKLEIKKCTYIKIINPAGETAKCWVTETLKNYFYVSLKYKEYNYYLKFSYKGRGLKHQGIKNNWKIETI